MIEVHRLRVKREKLTEPDFWGKTVCRWYIAFRKYGTNLVPVGDPCIFSLDEQVEVKNADAILIFVAKARGLYGKRKCKLLQKKLRSYKEFIGSRKELEKDFFIFLIEFED